MTRYVLVAFLCLLATDAMAQRIRDMSMSVEDTFKQGSAPAPSRVTPAPNSNYLRQNAVTDARAGDPYAMIPADNSPGNRFMYGYCDPNFRPAIAGNPHYAGMENCLMQQRKQACDMFTRLPNEVKVTLDSAIGCVYASANGDMADGRLATTAMDICAGYDSNRLQLLKRYWQDQSTSYALVFLPDMVLDSSGQCMRGGR